MTDNGNNGGGNHIPRIGDVAPDFTAITTHGELSFHNWSGDSWVLLFSQPADFTPVCSTELSELARRNSDFEQRNVKLIGLSVDSIHSHLAWRENLLDLGTLTASVVIAGTFHTWEVGHNVFKAW